MQEPRPGCYPGSMPRRVPILLLALLSSGIGAQVPPRHLAAGSDHSMMLDGLRVPRTCGSNQDGQLGLGPVYDQNTFQVVTPLPTNLVGISAGVWHTLAVDATGAVWSWGGNYSGQLGLGDTTTRFLPNVVTGLPSDVIAVAAGRSHSLALTAQGQVWAFGGNLFGQLGTGNNVAHTTPVQVPYIFGTAVEIAIGDDHSLARLSTGVVLAWGRNGSGQLGIGHTQNRNWAQQISSLPSDVSGIEGGGDASHAWTASGNLWSWGANGWGQLGLGNTTNRVLPLQVLPVAGTVQEVSAGFAHLLIRRMDGTLAATGSNLLGQLGLGDFTNRSSPTTVTALATQVVVSHVAGGSHTLALLADGSLRAWGYNATGQLGLGNTIDRNLPTPVTGLPPPGVTVAGPATHPVGQDLVWTITTVPATAGRLYYLDATFAGSSPGISLPPPSGLVVPLNPPLLYLSYGAWFPALFGNFVGLLDAAGSASPVLHLPAEPALAGLSITAACITLDPLGWLGVGLASNATTTLLTL